MKKYEEIFQEVYTNIQSDRNRLETLADNLQIQNGSNPVIAIARRIVDVMEGLSRTNEQMIEMMKSSQQNVEDEEKRSEGLWDEIQQGGKNVGSGVS